MANLKRVQFRAMVRKDCLQMRVKWCRTFMTILVSIGIGVVIGALFAEATKTLTDKDNPGSSVTA